MAAPVAPEAASAAVRGWLKADPHPLGKAMGSAVQRVETFRDKAGDPLYYAVYLAPSGFVIVPAEDSVEPIIAFADKGEFDASSGNPLGALVSSDLPGRVAQARGVKKSGPGNPAPQSGRKWLRFHQLSGFSTQISLGATNISLSSTNPGGVADPIAAPSDLRVGPLVQSAWDQSTAGHAGGDTACYNYYTPPGPNGNPYNYVCGCVATAMAQLMCYYQYPGVGVDTAAQFSYKVDGANQEGNLLGGSGSSGQYVWGNMPLVTSDGMSAAQYQEIGRLTHDAGFSVQMQYTAGVSGTDVALVPAALAGVFHYGNAVIGQVVGPHGETEESIMPGILPMVNPNLDAGYPVLLGIVGTNGGHCVICDGYGYSSSSLYHHLNMGWSGTDNAWYTLPFIDHSTGTFTNLFQCAYNIYTNGGGEIISGRVLTSQGLPVTNATVTASQNGSLIATALTSPKGIYALSRIPANSTYSLSVSAPGFATATTNAQTGISANNIATSGNVWGADITLLGSAVDHFLFGPIGSIVAVSNAFSVSLTAQNGTNGTSSSFAGTVALSAVGTVADTNTIVDNLTPGNWGQVSNAWTFGYAFTPKVDLQVIGVRSYGIQKVSIWTSGGTLVTNQTFPSGSAAWAQTNLPSPITLLAGTQYVIGGLYPANQDRCLIADPPSVFAHGTVDNYRVESGDAFPTAKPSPSLMAGVDLVYVAVVTVLVPIIPTSAASFVNGVWTGTISVEEVATNVVITADDGAEHTGRSGPFTVASSVATAQLVVSANPYYGGTVAINGGSTSGTFVVGAGVTISATANPAGEPPWLFAHWQDGNTANPRSVCVPDGGTNYTAAFVRGSTISVVASPTNAGTVAVNGGGTSGTFAVGANVTVSATANPGWIFTGWGNSGFSLDPDNPLSLIVADYSSPTYVANFAQLVTLSVTGDPTRGGAASAHLLIGSLGPNYSFAVGDEIGVLATANPGWGFTRWQDGDTNNPRLLFVTALATNFIASFVPTPSFAAMGFTNGHFQTTLSGPDGYPYVVYCSSNLVNWVPWQTVTTMNGTTNLSETNGAPGRRYYRVKP